MEVVEPLLEGGAGRMSGASSEEEDPAGEEEDLPPPFRLLCEEEAPADEVEGGVLTPFCFSRMYFFFLATSSS